ncbi:DUF427 domain-containing protein [uncultured Tateyamaria sp.]|uniref:DUF427 domain-containing protein n=1 Tax=uncultured Tateyamaria sp. TaxID=455651 RepID=UPI002631262D|nr:DUF427 domain-containing protein [uncultured Tateyamaria sp.]
MDLPVENVQTYPRPSALEPVPNRIRALFAGVCVADSVSALRVLETHHAPTYYLPRADVLAQLTPSPGGSFCEWKGRAQYWDLGAGSETAQSATWSYPSPSDRFAQLKDHVAIYAGKMEACFVAEVRVIPQPGDFYGGWMTANVQGQIKGAPGTHHC